MNYTDGEGKLPISHQLELQRRGSDGSWRAFTTKPLAAWAGSVRVGKPYAASRKLPAGEYRHRLRFTDTEGSATGRDSRVASACRWQKGPVVTDAEA